jgi:hypothetical protein
MWTYSKYLGSNVSNLGFKIQSVREQVGTRSTSPGRLDHGGLGWKWPWRAMGIAPAGVQLPRGSRRLCSMMISPATVHLHFRARVGSSDEIWFHLID